MSGQARALPLPGFLDWHQAYLAGPAACGGKGYNLARLARYGFRVPRGGVLSAGAPLPAIREGLERLQLADATVAVRSSATAEDSARASFAGIHRSFLNVGGMAEIERAAQASIDSLQTPEAVAYRRRMGFRDEEVQCAVVVCEMVPAVSAGVAFSCDPATGRRDLIVIDAAEGLGDAVVSGRVNPRRSVWRHEMGRLARESSDTACSWLPEKIEEELAHQVWRAQWALGEGRDPQDVEWAYDGRHLWILQARPVTNLPRSGWKETAALPRYWSTANLKDNQPSGWCELSWSALTDMISDALFAATIAVGYPLPPGMEIVRRFHGRGFFDLTIMEWGFYDSFGILPSEVVKTIGGRQPLIDVPPNPFAGAAGRRRQLAGLRLLRLVWNHPRRARPLTGKQIEYHRNLANVDWTRHSPSDLYLALEQIAQAQQAFIRVFGLANASSGPWQLALETIVKDPALVARLEAGTGAVASAEHGYRLYDLARGTLTLEEFLHEFGHRAIYETDAANPRWIEDPSWVLEQAEAMRRNPPARDPREAAAEVRRDAESELRRRFGWRARLLLWIARKLREGNAAREGTKSAMVAAILPVRRIVLEIGRRMVAAGQLDTPDDATQLAHIDIRCCLRGDWDGSGARELVADRRVRRVQWLTEPCPDVITEEPDGRMAASPAAERCVSDGWHGIAVSPGVAAGAARAVRNPHDAAHLQSGDILVAPSTDPGWTPLFLRAAAIVMETGGYLSHGSIVAREYGIPAVANVPGILDALEDGEQITVDGSAGRVTRA